MITRVLSPSSTSGADIRVLQQFLRGAGIYLGAVDGSYGPATTAAVRKWQKQTGLKADGVAGPQTIGAMLQHGLPLLVDPLNDVPPPPADMHPLVSNDDRMRQWGRFKYRPTPTRSDPEAIEITDGWEDANIMRVDCPIWGDRKVRLNVRVADDYVAFMKDIMDAGLAKRVLTFDGGFVPRFIRGSRTVLSNHSWGTAFDINADWNPMGRTPALLGEEGSVRQLVPMGVKHGWYWGGWFKRRDGMHFEHI